MCFPVCREWKPSVSPARMGLRIQAVHMCFPVCREWKRGFHSDCVSAAVSAHVLSRLQGMETHPVPRKCSSSGFVHMCFPVCREWKQVLPISQEQFLSWVSAHVLSRLQGMETCNLFNFFRGGVECTCAFPFAGNGNIGLSVLAPSHANGAHVLSRLQGMETGSGGFTVVGTGGVTCTCAFPFAGNGNI